MTLSGELRGDGRVLEEEENSEAVDDNQSEVVPGRGEPRAG